MGDYTIIRKCSSLCAMHEPCSINESGLCAQNNKRPVDYDALAMDLMRKFYGAPDDALIGSGDIPHMAQALREVMK